MLRQKHLFSEPVGDGHWNLKNKKTQKTLSFEVKDKQNRAGFFAFMVFKESDVDIRCVLHTNNDKHELDTIEKDLAQTIVDNSGFFETFKLSKTIEVEKSISGYMISTINPKTAQLMLNYVDRKLQFTSDHYN